MTNVIVIPVFCRDDTLAICLRYLKKCEEFQNYEILFKPEEHTSRNVYSVIEKEMENYSKWKILDEEKRKPQKPQYLTYNLLRGMEEGLKRTSEYFFLITDDWRVTKDFLKYQEYVYNHFLKDNPYFWSSYAFRFGIPQLKNYPHYNDVVVSSDFYSGACELIPKKQAGGKGYFEKFILSHINNDYFADMQRYIKKNFPYSFSFYKEWDKPRITNVGVDGLIDRVRRTENELIGETKYQCLGPAKSRCQSLDLRGIGRFDSPFKGPLEERIKKILDIVNSEKEYNKWKKNTIWCPFEEEVKWKKLELVSKNEF